MQSPLPCPPTIFNFGPLFKFDLVLAVPAPAPFVFLQIFRSGRLENLHAWQYPAYATRRDYVLFRFNAWLSNDTEIYK